MTVRSDAAADATTKDPLQAPQPPPPPRPTHTHTYMLARYTAAASEAAAATPTEAMGGRAVPCTYAGAAAPSPPRPFPVGCSPPLTAWLHGALEQMGCRWTSRHTRTACSRVSLTGPAGLTGSAPQAATCAHKPSSLQTQASHTAAGDALRPRPPSCQHAPGPHVTAEAAPGRHCPCCTSKHKHTITQRSWVYTC